MNNTQRKICEDAIQIFGVQHQLIKAAEELAELSQQVLKAANGEVNKGHIAEEIADVEIMLYQLKLIFGCEVSVSAVKDLKLDRLQGRIDAECLKRQAERC